MKRRRERLKALRQPAQVDAEIILHAELVSGKLAAAFAANRRDSADAALAGEDREDILHGVRGYLEENNVKMRLLAEVDRPCAWLGLEPDTRFLIE